MASVAESEAEEDDEEGDVDNKDEEEVGCDEEGATWLPSAGPLVGSAATTARARFDGVLSAPRVLLLLGGIGVTLIENS